MNLLDLFVTLEFKDNATAKIETATGKFTTFASSIGSGLEKAAELGVKALEKVGKAALEAGKYAVRVGSDFEATMSSVKAIGEFTAREMELITEKAKEMGIETKFSATEAGEAMYYMAQAGWDADQILSGIAGVMDMAAASGEDLAHSSDIVTDALTAFGYAAEESSRFADVLAKAAAATNTDVSKLGQTFKYVAPIAGTLGYSIEDVATAAGLMANAGIKASSAGTALRSVLSRMASPTEQVKGAMETLGISLTETDGTAKSLHGVIENLRDAFSGLSEDEQVAYASTLAAKTGMSGLLAVINASDEDFENLTASLSNASGAAQTMADTMQNNLKGKVEIFKSSVEGLGLVLYDYMVNPLSWLAEKGTAAIDALTRAVAEGGLSAGMTLLAEQFGKAVTDVTGHAQAFFEGMSAALSSEENHAKLRDAALSIAASVSGFIGGAVDDIGAGVVTFFGNLSSALTSEEARKSYAENGYEIAKNIVIGLGNLIQFGSELQSSVLEPLRSSFLKPGGFSWGDVGDNIIKGIIDGVTAAAPSLLEAVNSSIASSRSAISDFMDFFNEATTIPEEWMKEKDKQFGLGIYDDGSSTSGRIYENNIPSDTMTQWEGGPGLNKGGVTVNQNIYSEAKTAADLMEEARYEAERAVMFGV
jgi:TP901 family phage tail tape measure protein